MEKTVTQIAANITLTDKIFQYILDLPMGIVVIDDICKEKNKEEFVSALKRFMGVRGGEAKRFYIDCNSSFSKFQKYTLPQMGVKAGLDKI